MIFGWKVFLSPPSVGDFNEGDVVVVASDSFAFDPELLTVLLACLLMQSSLQYTELTRDGLMPHTMQLATIESDVDCGEEPASLILIDGWSKGDLRGKIF